jgi:sulfur-carrier protein
LILGCVRGAARCGSPDRRQVSYIGAVIDVTVRYFAAAAEAAGRDEEELSLENGATLGSLRSLLEARYGEPMAAVMRTGSFLIDKVVRRDSSFPLAARVDVLPPFAGG